MALTFDYVKDLSTGATPQISYEPDSTVYNYYIRNSQALDTHSASLHGDYSSVTFEGEERHLTTKSVERIGVKNFPGVGSIGFYKDLYSDDSRVVAPILVPTDRRDAPTLTALDPRNNALHVIITPPESIKYNVYRLIARQQYFAIEYILYKPNYVVDLPPVKGTYSCYCIGYDEKSGTISSESNIVELTLSTGADSWSPESIDMSYIERRLDDIEEEIGDVGAIIDSINGVEV